MSETSQPESGRASLRILLVEDDAASNKGLSRLLTAVGHEVQSATDGRSARERLDAGPVPDVLITDMQLPDVDGRELAREAKDRLPTLRVALITGWDVSSSAEELARWGIDEVLTKPIEFSTLVNWLAPRETP